MTAVITACYSFAYEGSYDASWYLFTYKIRKFCSRDPLTSQGAFQLPRQATSRYQSNVIKRSCMVSVRMSVSSSHTHVAQER